MKKNSESNLLMRYGSLFIGCALSLLIFSSAAAQYLSPPDDASQARVPKVTKFIYLPLILNKAAPGTPTTPPPGSTPTNTPTATATATSTQVPSQIVNGNFEQGRGVGWLEYNTRNPPLPMIQLGASLNPQVIPVSGQWVATLYAFQSHETSQIGQAIVLPSGHSYLNIYYMITSQEPLCDVPYYDAFTIYINTKQEINWNLCKSSSYLSNYFKYGYLDLTARGYLPGQTIGIVFEASTVDTGATTVYLDDISVDGTHH